MLKAPSEPPGSTPLASPSVPPVEIPLPGLWHVTWPLLVSLGLSLSLTFTDAFFLSRISDSAAAAAGAINPLLGATVVLFSVVGQAGASVAGRLHGARRHAELPLVYLVLLGFNLAAGLAISSLLFALHRYVPAWLGLRGEAEAAAQTYMAVLGASQVVKAVQLAYGNMLNSRGDALGHDRGHRDQRREHRPERRADQRRVRAEADGRLGGVCHRQRAAVRDAVHDRGRARALPGALSNP